MADTTTFHYATGQTLYDVFTQGTNIYNGTTTLVATSGATWTACAIARSEIGTTGVYGPPTLTNLPPGKYTRVIYRRLAGSAANTDAIIAIDTAYRHEIDVDAIVYGTATAGTANTITLDSSASATNSLYVGMVIHIVGGTGAGQSRVIVNYEGLTRVANIERNWTTNPASGSVYVIGPAYVTRAVHANDAKLGSLMENYDESGAAWAITVNANDANGQALATAANLTTVLNRVGTWAGTGVNTILGGIRALANKAAGIATPSDLTSGGGTFDNTTDSSEAMRDRGDSAWGSVTVTPLVATTTNPRYSTRDLPNIAQGSQPTEVWTIVDGAGAAVNLSGKTVRCVAFLRADGTDDDEAYVFDDVLTGSFEYETGGNGITVGGAGNNVVTLVHSSSKTATAGDYEYMLWNATDKLLLAKGAMPIEPSVFDV